MPNLTSCRFQWLAVAALVAGVLLFLGTLPAQPHTPTEEHITGATNNELKGNAARHQTVWECISNCKDDAGVAFNEGDLDDFSCDEDVESDEHFWWEITEVSGGDVAMPTGDAAWGKTTIVNDDSNPPPTPAECGQGETENCVTVEDLPWRVTAENVGLSRPTDSV